MHDFKNIWTFSKKILAIIGLFYFLNYIMDGRLANLLALSPILIAEKSEFWRIFTFPLAPSSLEGILFSFFILYAIGPKLEEFLSFNLYPMFIFLLISMQGIIHTLVFWKSPVQLSGFEGIAFFILVMFTLLNPRQKIKLWFLPSLRIIFLSPLLVLFWIISSIIHIKLGNHHLFYPAMSVFVFGITMGMIFFFQFQLINKFYLRKRELQEATKPKKQEYEYAAVSNGEYNKSKHPISDNYHLLEDDPILNEQRLNTILDKINEKGKESLTTDELHFLDEYSKQI